MYKINVHTIIKKGDKAKFDQLCLMKGLTKRDLFVLALNEFVKLTDKKTKYVLRYQEFDRIYDQHYSLTVYQDTLDTIKQLSKKLNSNNPQIIREVICSYINGN